MANVTEILHKLTPPETEQLVQEALPLLEDHKVIDLIIEWAKEQEMTMELLDRLENF